MTLKKRDGTDYKLDGPNPIMSDQGLWNKGHKLILHNLRGRKNLVSYEDAQVVFRNGEAEPIPILETVDGTPVPEPLEEKPDPFDVVEIPEIPIIASIDGDRRAELDVEQLIHVWCLPAYFRQYKDDAVEDTVSKVRYGQKFLFEAVMGDIGDMHMILFTTTDSVTEGSILYPKTHDKRWWRVMETQKGRDGLIRLYATFTDYHPEFSAQ